MKHEAIAAGASTAIGSLPHHNIDAALEYAFGFDVPFLPQIPIRNAWEYSIPQGLEGLPGIRVEADGATFLDKTVWVGRAKAFEEMLSHAFDLADQPSAFEAFEPSAATASTWQPFLWELQERGKRVAKVQLVGPLTAQWSLRSTEGQRLDQHPDISRQIFRLILARSLGMVRRLKSLDVKPVLFLDEPALFALTPESPGHLVGLQQQKLLIQSIQKEGAAVGIHCCSNTRWDAVLGTGIDFLSFDVRLSLGSLVTAKEPLERFLAEGGRLALGIIPTSPDQDFGSLKASELVEVTSRVLSHSLGALGSRAFAEALWTPACGLALHTPNDAQVVFSLLAAVQTAARISST